MQLFGNGKRILGILTALCLSFGCIEYDRVDAESKIFLGDCNADGQLDQADVLLLRSFLCGEEIDLHTSNADWNLDGAIDVRDLTFLKHEILNPKLPESAVLLVYQCGSDLESQALEATVDMDEMMRATHSENLKIVLETGGSKRWHHSYANAEANYRITIGSDGVSSKKISKTPKNMGDAETLRQFIVESVKEHPADRYGLIIWDHGAGPIYGCCYDELADDLLTIPELCTGLKKGGVYFDFIGFDCCLMGSAEVAYAIRDYADYMVASEETESGYGWYYKDFLTIWAKDVAIPTEELVKEIVDDMVGYNQQMGVPIPAVLAAYDLDYAQPLMESVYLYINDVMKLAQSQGQQVIYNIRSEALDLGEEEYDLVDLGDIVDRLKTVHSDDVKRAISDMVIHKQSVGMSGECGVNLWFYEKYPEDCQLLDQMYSSLGISEHYINTMKKMAMDFMRMRQLQSSIQTAEIRTDPWFEILWKQYRNE